MILTPYILLLPFRFCFPFIASCCRSNSIRRFIFLHLQSSSCVDRVFFVVPFFLGVHLSNVNHKPETSGSGLKHNSVVSLDWTLEQQAILEEGLKNYKKVKKVERAGRILEMKLLPNQICLLDYG
ncbi:hypothetical protein GQ457_14G003200 [Hibiscus cannabinus]